METKQTSIDRRAVAGLLLIAAGALLLLDMGDLLPFNLRYYIISWKTLLIGIGLITMANRDNRTTGAILVGLGLLFWMPELLDYRVRLSAIFWPAVLIGIGLIMLSRRTGSDGHRQKHIFSGSNRQGVTDEDLIDELAIFGGGNTRITSQNFKGGKVTAIFGGSDIDMKATMPSKAGCVIDVFTLFGGNKLIVSDDWQIKSEVVAIFGGFSDKRIVTNERNPEKLMIIKGVVLFGGVEIKSY
jgi:predicted membrane protein